MTNAFRSTALAGLALSALCLAGPLATAAPAAPAISADTLARNLANVVRSTEKAHKGGADTLTAEVQLALQNLISAASPPPATVKSALEQVLSVCPTPGLGEKQGIACPGEAGSIVALQNLLGLVKGLVKDSTGDVTTTSGNNDNLPLPTTGGGGSDYRRTP